MIESTRYSFSLEHAEVGDKLMVSQGGFGPSVYAPVTITKVTQTSITTSDGNRWNIRTKRCIGTGGYSPCLNAWDEALYLETQQEYERRRLARIVGDWRFHDLPYDVLLRIHEILLKAADEEKKAKETK